jgi:hypothetical protein
MDVFLDEDFATNLLSYRKDQVSPEAEVCFNDWIHSLLFHMAEYTLV